MKDWEAIFEGSPESARDLAARLEQAGLHPFVEGRNFSHSTENYESFGSAAVLVPSTEKQKAGEVTFQWRAFQPERVAHLTARLSRVVGLSLVPPALWFVTYFLMPGVVPRPGVGWLVLLFFASLIVFGRIEHHRYEREHVRSPAA